MNADAEVIREQSALLADWADNSDDAEDVDGCRAEIIAALDRLLARVEQVEQERDELRKALETTECTMPVSLFGGAVAPCVVFSEANPSMPVTICDRCAALAAVSPPQEGEA